MVIKTQKAKRIRFVDKHGRIITYQYPKSPTTSKSKTCKDCGHSWKRHGYYGIQGKVIWEVFCKVKDCECCFEVDNG